MVKILQLKFDTQKYSSKKSCTFNRNLSLSFRNNEILVYWALENMNFYGTCSIKTKTLSMLGTGYFLKIAKMNSRQEKPICPYRKN